MAKESSEEYVNPRSTARLSRRNVLALALSVTGVLLVLFFSSRRTSPDEPEYRQVELPASSYPILEPIEPSGPVYTPGASQWTMPDIPGPHRPDERELSFDQARRSGAIVHSMQPAEDSTGEQPASKRSRNSAYVLREGSIIDASLETAIHTGRPGAVKARVVRPVRDSNQLKQVLIPAGTQLLGELVQVLSGEEPRAVIAWTRMVFPDGTSRTLPQLPALESSGESGLQDQVKRYRLRRFGSATLLALVGGTTSLAAASTHAALAGQSLAMELSRSATGQLERGRQRQPVVILRPGYRFIVYVSEDLAFDAPYLS